MSNKRWEARGQCLHCGAAFSYLYTGGRWRRYCSERCKDAAKYQRKQKAAARDQAPWDRRGRDYWQSDPTPAPAIEYRPSLVDRVLDFFRG